MADDQVRRGFGLGSNWKGEKEQRDHVTTKCFHGQNPRESHRENIRNKKIIKIPTATLLKLTPDGCYFWHFSMTLCLCGEISLPLSPFQLGAQYVEKCLLQPQQLDTIARLAP